MRVQRRELLVYAVIALVTLAAYSRTFWGEFQFDDYQIIDNPAVHQPEINRMLAWARTRILPFSTLVLNYQLSGAQPFSYHLVNFIVHLLATFIVFLLALELCRTPTLRDGVIGAHSLLFAGAAAFLFACHPIQIQAVTYIAQRVSSMAAFFYIGSVFFYVRARNRTGNGRASYAACIGFALAAILSKENAASLPLMIVLVEVVFFGRRRLSRVPIRLAPLLLLILAIPVLWQLFPDRRQPSIPDSLPWWQEQVRRVANILAQPAERSDISPYEYFLTQTVVIPRYLQLVFVPRGFNVDHDVPIEHDLSAPVVGGVCLLAGLLGLGIYSVRRHPLVGFGILWVFIALAVESSFVPIRDPMNEHRMYLAMPGIAFVVASLFTRAVTVRPTLAWTAGAAAAALLSMLTLARNEVWRTQRALWTDALEKSPGKARVHANYGTALHLDGELDEAIEEYCKALKIDPGLKRARSNINIAQQEQLAKGEVALEVRHQRDGTVIGVAVDPCPPGTDGDE